jgi:hypothetical protein
VTFNKARDVLWRVADEYERGRGGRTGIASNKKMTSCTRCFISINSSSSCMFSRPAVIPMSGGWLAIPFLAHKPVPGRPEVQGGLESDDGPNAE